MKRRDLLKFGAIAGAATLTGCTTSPSAQTKKSAVARVVVVGGGPGGISAAQNIKKTNPEIEVILVERNIHYSTCFGGNWLYSDIASKEDLTFNYQNLPKEHNIKVIHDEVTGVDADRQLVKLALRSQPLEYDRLVVSPGISFRWDMIEGHDESTAFMVPHAWKAGYQALMLKAQLNAMPDNGTMVLAAPPNPFRCPPGPYERASMIAAYMKREKPKAKLIILDAKDKFSKQGKFTAGWEKHYGFGTDNAIIEWVSKSMGGDVRRIDPHKKELVTTDGETIKADVINYVPAQKANTTAARMGLVDASGWCPIDQQTFESKLVANIHVLGDASIAKPMPKSAFSADSQGQVCGRAVANLLSSKKTDATASFANHCFSLVTADYGISVVAAYKLNNRKIEKTSGGLLPTDGNFKREAQSAQAWYAGMVGTMFK